MVDHERGTDPRQVEANVNRTLAKLATVGVLVMFVLWAVSVALGGIILLNLQHANEARDKLIKVIDTQDLAHRQRNEDIHSCVVEKQDQFRRDIHSLLLTKPGQIPDFPLNDGIVCPPIDPNTGKTIPPPFAPPTTTTPGATTTVPVMLLPTTTVPSK